MTRQYPRWASPLGVKLTDWVAVIAFILSVAGLLATAIARQLYPSIDVAYPEEIQLQCVNYDYDDSDGDPASCASNSPIRLTADLFSIWNDSIFSTKPQILQRIDAIIESNNAGEISMQWKYFTEIVDSENKRKGNSGRAIFYYGDLRNIEVEFFQNQTMDETLYTWSVLASDITNGDITIIFSLDFAYGSDTKTRCDLTFRDDDIDSLRSEKYTSHYVVADAMCEELAVD